MIWGRWHRDYWLQLRNPVFSELQHGSGVWETVVESQAHLSAPALETVGTVVYIAAAAGNVYALLASNGIVTWTFSVGANVNAPTIGADEKVFLGSHDLTQCALDGVSGALNWSFSANQMLFAAAVGGDGTVYAGSPDQHLCALDGHKGAV